MKTIKIILLLSLAMIISLCTNKKHKETKVNNIGKLTKMDAG